MSNQNPFYRGDIPPPPIYPPPPLTYPPQMYYPQGYPGYPAPAPAQAQSQTQASVQDTSPIHSDRSRKRSKTEKDYIDKYIGDNEELKYRFGEMQYGAFLSLGEQKNKDQLKQKGLSLFKIWLYFKSFFIMFALFSICIIAFTFKPLRNIEKTPNFWRILLGYAEDPNKDDDGEDEDEDEIWDDLSEEDKSKVLEFITKNMKEPFEGDDKNETMDALINTVKANQQMLANMYNDDTGAFTVDEGVLKNKLRLGSQEITPTNIANIFSRIGDMDNQIAWSGLIKNPTAGKTPGKMYISSKTWIPHSKPTDFAFIAVPVGQSGDDEGGSGRDSKDNAILEKFFEIKQGTAGFNINSYITWRKANDGRLIERQYPDVWYLAIRKNLKAR